MLRARCVSTTLEGSGNADHDRDLKRRLYEEAGILEYWLVEPGAEEIIFYRLGADGRYQPLVVDRQGVPPQPCEWVTFLEQEKYQAVVRRHTAALMRHAQYQSHQLRPAEIFFHGEIPQLPEVSAFGETRDECEQNLAEMVRNWVLLRIGRQQEIPTLK